MERRTVEEYKRITDKLKELSEKNPDYKEELEVAILGIELRNSMENYCCVQTVSDDMIREMVKNRIG